MFQKILTKEQYWKEKTNMEIFIREVQDEVPLEQQDSKTSIILYV